MAKVCALVFSFHPFANSSQAQKNRGFDMSVEKLIQGVLAATPAKRAKIEAVLNGSETVAKKDAKAETRLVTIAGTAKMLAISRNTVYRLIAKKRLDVVELNGCQRVTMKSINEFIEGERPSADAKK